MSEVLINGRSLGRSCEHPLDRIEAAADMVDSLAGLIGQASDIDACGRDGLGGLLNLIAEDIAAFAAEIRTEVMRGSVATGSLAPDELSPEPEGKGTSDAS